MWFCCSGVSCRHMRSRSLILCLSWGGKRLNLSRFCLCCGVRSLRRTVVFGGRFGLKFGRSASLRALGGRFPPIMLIESGWRFCGSRLGAELRGRSLPGRLTFGRLFCPLRFSCWGRSCLCAFGCCCLCVWGGLLSCFCALHGSTSRAMLAPASNHFPNWIRGFISLYIFSPLHLGIRLPAVVRLHRLRQFRQHVKIRKHVEILQHRNIFLRNLWRSVRTRA